MENPLNEKLFSEANTIISRVKKAMANSLVGKTNIVDAILIAAMSGGHVLLEGVPGLAKTLAVRSFADVAGLTYKRIQFTPDLLPGDITGTVFYDTTSGKFIPRQGPVFANIVLADEINRAPAKVQSALLEAMEECQVTMGENSLALPDPFIVLATQNPIEQEGTFHLPEAQLDRFMLKILVDYPSEEEELEIVTKYANQTKKPGKTGLPSQPPVIIANDIRILSSASMAVRFDEKAASYALAIVRATRAKSDSDNLPVALRDLSRYIEYGASPRGSLALYKASRALAILSGRDYVLPEDIKRAAPAVLRHRIVPSYEADAERISSEQIIRAVLTSVSVP